MANKRGFKQALRWTDHEKQVLVANYHGTTTDELLAMLPGRTMTMIRSMAANMKLRRGKLGTAVPPRIIVDKLHDGDESEFLTTVVKFRSAHGRPPTLVEGFRLAKSIGWGRS